MDTECDPWYIRALLHVRFAWLPFNVWPILVLVAVLVACLCGCITGHDAAGIRAEIEHIAGQVNELGLTVGDVTLHGGQGDSITMWILAAGAAVVYPIVWRPIREKLERKRKKAA